MSEGYKELLLCHVPYFPSI